MKKLSTRWLTNSLIITLGVVILVAAGLISYKYWISSASGTCKFEGYKQTDSRWASKKFGLGEDGEAAIMAKAGCGPTAISSVFKYYFEQKWGGNTGTAIAYGEHTPDKVADYFLTHSDSSKTPCRINGSGTNSNCFKSIALAWGFSYNKVTNFSEAVKFLQQGKPLIALVGCGGGKIQAGDRTRYTGCPNGGHYIVLTKLSGSTVSIWDPNKDNTSDNINNFANSSGFLKDGFWYIYR